MSPKHGQKSEEIEQTDPLSMGLEYCPFLRFFDAENLKRGVAFQPRRCRLITTVWFKIGAGTDF